VTNASGPSEEDIHLAQDLLAEWDEGRGTSKSEIERRVWGDGAAHGRRFDRFIRQTLGASTNRPSKQTDRIGALESQLRRIGIPPDGTTFDEWEEQLHHGRNAALAALRVWNDPTATFRSQAFALLLVTGWNSIALALLQRREDEWRELHPDGSPVLFDNREKAKDTAELIELAFPGIRYEGLRRNVNFWIGLRNQVAHRDLPALNVIVIPQAQAALLNLESVLEENFGTDYLLAEQLSVPLQLSGFRDPTVLASVKTLQSSLPLDVQLFLARAESHNDRFVEDPTYQLRVTFLPTVPSSGRNPDVVAWFVRPGEVSDDLGQALKEYTVLPKVITPPRPNLIASQVVEAVGDRIPFTFKMLMHTTASRNLKVRPQKDAEDETATDIRYCEYVTSVKRYLYSQAWVDRLADELSTPEGFLETTGFTAQPRT
jgi:hypothetical protein